MSFWLKFKWNSTVMMKPNWLLSPKNGYEFANECPFSRIFVKSFALTVRGITVYE